MVIRVALPIPLRLHFDYLCDKEVSPGCRVLVPFGKRELIGIVWQLNPTDSFEATQLKAVTEVLDQIPVLAAPIRQLLSFAADYYHHPLGDVLTSALPALLRDGKNADPLKGHSYSLTEAGQHLTAEQFKAAKKRLALWQQLQQPQTESQLLQHFQRKELQYFVEQGWAQVTPVLYGPYQTAAEQQKSLPLNPAQALAVTAVQQALGSFSCFLLEGVTGSGKTEVYLQTISPVVKQGGQVLVLVSTLR